jgi:stearoyl-CoA desaturase (delta-9 desaturase)
MLANNLRVTRFTWAAGYAALIFTLYYCFTTGEWVWLLGTYAYYKVVSLFSNNIALHRYFSHRAFKPKNKLTHYFLCFVSILVGQDTPIFYASGHRHHHRYSDRTRDIHSPQNQNKFGLSIWSLRSTKWFAENKEVRVAKDLFSDNGAVFIHRFYLLVWAAFASLVYITLGWKVLVFLVLPCIALNSIHMGLFRITYLHQPFPGNYRNFDDTNDHSYNNIWLQALDTGEGLHNNHHKYPNKYDQAVQPWEHDPSAFFIKHFLAKKES